MKTAEQIEQQHALRSLSQTIERVKKDGYVKNFMVNESGLLDLDTNTNYAPEQVKISNFYRFEGESDPADSSILYAIETQDGGKGILTDSYGTYADSTVNDFIRQVEEIQKKPHRVRLPWVNIGTAQRIGSIAAGALILLASAQAARKSKSKAGYLLPLLGALGAGVFMYRGSSGHCAVKAYMDKK